MSTFVDRLSQIFSLAKSKKVTDYKKAIKLLLEFLDDNSEIAFEQITEYSKNPGSNVKYNSYSWNNIFNIVHELFIIEIDRISKLSGNSGKLDKDRIIKLIYSITDKANYYLKAKDVILSNLQVLEIKKTHIYSEFYELYLGILRKHVLQERSQRILVDPNLWQDLLNACISILKNIIPNIDYVKLLQVVELIVQYGCSLSTLLFEIRNLLPIIANLLENYELYHIKSTDILFKLTYTVCQQIAIDSRYILSRFSENMPLTLINLKGPEEKYKLYLLLIQIHHPNGATLGDDVCYIHDQDKWKAILNLLYKMIINDIRSTMLTKSFIALSCEVFRQKIFMKLPNLSQSSTLHDSIYIQPKKRRRTSDNIERLVDFINGNDPERAWPIIQIAAMLYKKYPDCLKFDEYMEFLDVIIKLLRQACKNFYIMENLCNLATVFLQNEKRYKEIVLITYWNKVWDSVLRYLSMNHQEIIKEGYILVQNLIIYEKISNPNTFLKLYLTKSIQWSNFSIQTLRIFCENIVLPNEIEDFNKNFTLSTNNSLKIQLLEWTLNMTIRRLTIPLPIEAYSKILIGFTLKSWYKILKNDSQNNFYNSCNMNFKHKFDNVETIATEDIERCYLSLKFQTGLFVVQTNNEDMQILNENNTENPYIIEDLNFLIKSLIQSVQVNDRDKDFNSFITKTTLMAKVISDLKAMKMIECNFDEFCLVNELKICLTKIVDHITNINWSKATRLTLEITKSLILLCDTNYDVVINDIILRSINFQMLKKIYNICKIEDDEFEPDSNTDECKINAITILALYCCIDAGSEMSELQIKISSTLLKLKKYSLSIQSDVICVTTILNIFVNMSNNLIREEFIELLVNFIIELFEEWRKDNIITHCLLQHLPKILEKITYTEDKDNINIHNILLICKLYHDCFAKGVYGQLTHLSFINCLNNIIKDKKIFNTKIDILNDQMFITFINSPYYLVRFENLKCLNSIFSSSKFEHSWKSNFFDKLEDAIYKLFLIQRELNIQELQEERLLRSTSALQTLAVVICSKSTFQSSALFTLLKIVVDKDIDINIAKHVLHVIENLNTSCKCIVIQNFNYLFSRWCREKSLDSFPYLLFNCTSETDFYKRYIDIIFPVLIREGQINDTQSICHKLGVPFEQTLKNCCSKIIPWMLTDESSEIRSNPSIFEEMQNCLVLERINLQEVIIHLVERLHDVDDFYITFNKSIILPAFDPPHYKKDVINCCFDRLTTIICGENYQSVLLFIMTRHSCTVQKILLQLTCNIYANNIIEYKAKSLHQYVYFCSKIAEVLKESYCDPVATYFIKDIGCTLLNLIKENNDITQLACKYLHIFLKTILPKRFAEVGNILNLCVKTLSPFILDKTDCLIANDILNFLLKEQSHCLVTPIENLDSLPNILRSTNDQDTESQLLRENMEHFLNVSEDENCSLNSLLILKNQLIIKKCQLEELYEELESSQGFDEYSTPSVLHRLIYRLIRLTEYKNTTIVLEAAKCLGILGPANLSTMILHPQEMQMRESIDKVDLLTRDICRMLADFVVSSDINLRIVSSEALYAVLDTPWGTRLIEREFDNDKTSTFFKDFLYPFRSLHNMNRIKVQIDITEYNQVFCEDNPLWTEKSNESYGTWIANITSAVANCLTNFYSKNLVPLFNLHVQFCELTLPRLISLIIHDNLKLTKKVCQCINQFFKFYFYKNDETNEIFCSSSQKISTSIAHDAIRCMLNVVSHLRIQTKEQMHLEFDYLPIALAAQFCSAYFSSILYAELWCRVNLKISRDFDSIPIIDQIYEQENKQGKLVQDILKEAYIKIGDVDSIYGCGSSHLQNRKSRIPYYMNFKKLDKLILSQDVELSVVSNSSTRGMINALKESSLHYLAKCLLSKTSGKPDFMDDLCYDSLWRLSDWNRITNLKTSRTSKNICDFSMYHYEALKCLHKNDNSSLKSCLEQAYFCIIKDLSNISLESCKAVYPKLSQLQMLREIEEFSSTKSDDYEILFVRWNNQKYICNNSFQYIEPILSQRLVMFQIQESLKNSTIVKNALINVQLEIAQLAQQQGYLNVAARALESLSKQIDLDEETENQILYYEACLAWMRNDEDMARFNLRSLLRKDSINLSLLARTLRIYGNWIAENKSENPQAIISKYYKKAINTYSAISKLTVDDLKNKCKSCAALAQFAHEQYLIITDYMKSPQFESLKECIDYSRNVVPKSIKMNDVDVLRAVKINSKQSSNDCIELENIQKDKITYLSLAIKNYLSILQDSDEYDLLVFRLISLWLDNMYDEEVNKLIEKQLEQIPSYKFIVLVPQLAPHMSNISDIFTRKIFQLLERCAKEHPHHTLPTLLALKNLHNDSKFCSRKVARQEPRVLGAQQLIQQLLCTNIRPIIQEMDRLSDALVMLAYFDLDKKNTTISKISIPKNVTLHDIRDFEHSIIPTVIIDVKKNGNYRNIISVKKYESMYSNVGGINAPKRIICIGTDGVERRQLVKGKDDLRQDAVMQQVFTVMNSLLKSNKNAKQRKLYIRTYKVVPLTQRSGVLQWCENTLPLSCILTGDGTSQIGLHQKYFPNDYAPNDCRKRLHVAKTIQQKYNIFMDCCNNLHPAFHHFFTENYLSPEIWFERRLAYTRSVATTSIIGYILGLGDRHVSNILIDKSTAEVIHIDFGIAFEQGKLLPTPETVPFRLTRDIEIAMGVSGIEGTMRKCCEQTMTVLREQKEIIVTLLRVLLYDPLYSWAITPAKAATYQSEHSTRSSQNKESNSPAGVIETNKLAERALLRVQQKLQGIEDGVPSSIAGQVERLIQQARDPTNLSRLFEGWQAYL
ncbi:PREDICTED: serine-protein kinase ATM [Ceratosolen solmsi marchali]|uniref:Serine/threonine-protein kinase ATM n=1 Tax=Ceratosolen solmsi marchali TaxID=326594 RepID=A0AAJ6VK62_9HYME|nr:PREDICTED: serine-protein kinase ATM [Ceratosolen solmsi marchali]